MSHVSLRIQRPVCRWWEPIFYASLAGGMGWGIRGQYGHETGAMIAGVLVSLTLTYLLCPRVSSLSMARAVAWGTLAMGIGGSMTYGQTVGLTHDGPLIGNWASLRWGMLGLAIKGGIWIGFAGAFLGMGWSRVRYRAIEILLLLVAMLGAFFIGLYLFNSPFDPENEVLPLLYFSDHWHWEPEGGFKPRYEQWGGLLLALAALVAYTGGIRKDRLACSMALWGVLGGAIGFPTGQCFQAFNAWNRDMLSGTWWDSLALNWWNVMETVFGAVMGAVLGLGAWVNRALIHPAEADTTTSLSRGNEIGLLVIHLPLLIAVEFLAIPAVDLLYDLGLIMVIIPLVAVAGGRWWPYLQVLPLTLVPIVGKTIRVMLPSTEPSDLIPLWWWYVIFPLSVTVMVAVYFIKDLKLQRDGVPFVRWSLLTTAWTYFYLNYAFFGYPWPWLPWGGRTLNGLIFAFCVFGLTVLAVKQRKETAASLAE